MGINRDKVLASAQKHVRKGNWDKAISAYESLVENDPSDVRSRLKLGDLHVKNNDFEFALDTYQEVAYLYAKDDFYEKAAAVYKQALRIAPENPILHKDLGEAYFRLGRLKDAVRSFHRAQKLFKASGDDNEQRAILERMTQIDPEDVGLKVQLAERYEKDGFREDAIALFDEAADTLREEGRHDEFLQVGERIVYLDPERHPTRKEIIRIYISRGDDRRALKHLQAGFRKTPKDVQILEMLAKTFGRVGNPDKAVLVYQELANAYTAVNQPERARGAYRSILKLDPENEVARKELGDEYEDSATFRTRDTGSIEKDPETRDLDGIEFLDEEDDEEDALEGVEFLDEEDEDYQTFAPGGASDQANDFLRFAEETVAGVDADLSRLDDDPASSLADKRTEVSDITDSIVEVYHETPTQDGGSAEDEIGAMLTETDVFLKYGLFERAESTISRIIELAPENLRAREQMRRFFELTGEREAAAGQLIQMARIASDDGDLGEASEYLRRALDTTDHPERVHEFAERLGVGLDGPEELEEIGLELIDEISEGISEASEGFESFEEPGAHTVDLEPEVGERPETGLSGDSAVEDDFVEEIEPPSEADDIAGMLIEEMEGGDVYEEDFTDFDAVDVGGASTGEVEMMTPVQIDEDLVIEDFDDADLAAFDELEDLQDLVDLDEIEDFGDIEEEEIEIDPTADVVDLDVDDVDFDASELDALQDELDGTDFEFSFTEGETDEMFSELFGGSSLDIESDDGTAEEVADGFNPFGGDSLSSRFQAEISEMADYDSAEVPMNSNMELGETYREMGLWTEALDEFKQALDDPEVEHAARFNMALCEIELGEFEAASERLEKLSEATGVPSPVRNAAVATLEEISGRSVAGT